MTGIYFRVERDGKWETLDLSEMTVPEIKEALEKYSKIELITTVSLLVDRMKYIEAETINDIIRAVKGEV